MMFYVVYSESTDEWEVLDFLPDDLAGRGFSEWEDFGRAELDAQYRNQERS
jgi:hypothetical protein